LAEVLLKYSVLPVNRSLIEIQEAGRTGKNAITKFVDQPTFAGEIKLGQEYILVDDAIAQGDTIAELRHFVENTGGKVVDVHGFAAAQFSQPLVPRASTIDKIEEKFGREEAQKAIQDLDVAGSLEALTEREARYLLSFGSIDTLRDRAAADTAARVRGLVRLSVKEGQISEIAQSFTDIKTDPQGIGGINLPAQGLPPAAQRTRVATTGRLKGPGIMVRILNATRSFRAISR
jgi:hypothetical protein